jgi:hypothetical protein
MRKGFPKTIYQLQSGSQNDYSGVSELIDLEIGLPNYNLDVVEKFAKGMKLDASQNTPLRIIEFGAGTGALAQIFQSQFCITPTCIEIDCTLIKILESKSFEVFESISHIKGEVEVIYTSNVLEHIENDLSILEELRAKLVPGGKLLIYVPALPLLFSDLDRRVGHFRRYRKKELRQKVSSAGFEIQECYYNDCIGVLASIAMRIFGFKNSFGIGSRKSLVLYDTVVYPISKVLDRMLFRKILGKNLFLIARNPGL